MAQIECLAAGYSAGVVAFITMANTLMKSLQDYTSARVALSRAGSSLGVRDVLDLQLAHARARDAVHQSLDLVSLPHLIEQLPSVRERKLSLLKLESAVSNRAMYLQRPDL